MAEEKLRRGNFCVKYFSEKDNTWIDYSKPCNEDTAMIHAEVCFNINKSVRVIFEGQIVYQKPHMLEVWSKK